MLLTYTIRHYNEKKNASWEWFLKCQYKQWAVLSSNYMQRCLHMFITRTRTFFNLYGHIIAVMRHLSNKNNPFLKWQTNTLTKKPNVVVFLFTVCPLIFLYHTLSLNIFYHTLSLNIFILFLFVSVTFWEISFR